MSADLAQVLLPEYIRGLHRARRSGLLEATSSEATKGVFFLEGRIVFASSTLARDKLGENLIQMGRINRAEFMEAYRAAHAPERRLGAALVGAGLIHEDELQRLVAQQVENIVLSLFTWTAGDVIFHEAPSPIPMDLALDLSTRRLLLEGARIYPDAARLEQGLGDLRRKVGLSATPPFDCSSFPFGKSERAVLAGASQGRTLEEIVGSGARASLARAAYALMVGGIVTDGQDAGDAFEVDTGSFRASHG